MTEKNTGWETSQWEVTLYSKKPKCHKLFFQVRLNFCLAWNDWQARRQDVAAGGGTFFKYSIGCIQQPVGQT